MTKSGKISKNCVKGFLNKMTFRAFAKQTKNLKLLEKI